MIISCFQQTGIAQQTLRNKLIRWKIRSKKLMRGWCLLNHEPPIFVNCMLDEPSHPFMVKVR